MSLSPFHGIFSSLGDASSKGKLTTKQVAESSPIPPPSSTAGRVAVDIYEQDDYYIIKAPIAGVRLSDIDIEVNDNVITIKGRRHQGDQNITQDQYYIQECFWGEFSRSVTLPCAIDPRKVKATLNKECILKVLVPKEDRVKVVRINEA